MHHKKQKGNANSGAAKDGETMQRLRYLNKKPLCLQYNVQTGNGRRNSQQNTKRKEPSLLVVLTTGMLMVLQYFVSLIQNEFWEFLSKPADELFPAERSYSRAKPSPVRARRRASLSRRYINCTYRRDYGRTARIMELREQRTQLCYV